MSREKADFHVHIGTRTNEDIFQEAINNQVRVLGLLDRGAVDCSRLTQLKESGRSCGIEVVPGIECLTEIRHKLRLINFELIGLNFDEKCPAVFDTFDVRGGVNLEKHDQKVTYQRTFLQSCGFKLQRIEANEPIWKMVEQDHVFDTAYKLCQIAARSQLNRGLFEDLGDEIRQHLEKRPQDRSDLYSKFLYWRLFAPGKPGFRKWYLDASTIINTVHEGGGIVLLAHPNFQHSEADSQLPEMLDFIFDLGIDGVEGWDAGLLDKRLAKEALKRGGLVLGGSGTDQTNYSNRSIGLGEISNPLMHISSRRLCDILRYSGIICR